MYYIHEKGREHFAVYTESGERDQHFIYGILNKWLTGYTTAMMTLYITDIQNSAVFLLLNRKFNLGL